eukprot:8392592-Heterocapsa_arctica.AAC.1
MIVRRYRDEILPSGRRRRLHVHFAPPCGTCSRAREIPVRGGSGPPPLRSAAHPAGLPSLRDVDLDKVLAANPLYEAVSSVVLDELAQGHAEVTWSVENPTNSWM